LRALLKPISFSKAGVTTNFVYDMNEQRYKKQISSGKIVLYLGKTYEKVTNSPTNIDHKYYIYANGKVAAMYTKPQTHSFNFSRTQYLHYDNLGSVDAITNNLGDVEQRMAYKPFGDRYALDKNGNLIDKAPMTTRGYTGHEHLEEFDFIHRRS